MAGSHRDHAPPHPIQGCCLFALISLPQPGGPQAAYLIAVPEFGIRAPALGTGAGEAGRGVWPGQLRRHGRAQALAADVASPERCAVLHLPQPHGAARGQGHTAPTAVPCRREGEPTL